MMTLDDQDFILYQDEDMVILTTNNNLRVLADCHTLFMDGTFKVAPRIYQQLWTIHGQYQGYIVPLVFALIGDKRKETYYEVADRTKRRKVQLDLILKPETLTSDFETGLLPAIRHHFPMQQ